MKKKCNSCKIEFIDKANRKKRIRKFCSRICNSNAHKGWKRTDEQALTLLKKRYEQKIIKNIHGCWRWTGTINTSGYGVMNYKNKSIGLHRASWLMNFGNIPKGKWVLHHCDVRDCSNPSHLYLGNAQDNTNDMIRRGRENYIIGVISKKRKLSDEIVKQIKKDLSNKNLNHREIARKYKCHSHTIGQIESNKIYRDIVI